LKKNKRITASLISLSLLAFCLSLTPALSIANPTETEKTPLVKRPDFILQDMDGNIRDVIEWDGKVLVIVFGATWSPYVHIVMNMLTELQEKYNDHGVQFIYISINDDEGTMSDFLKEFNLNFPMLMPDVNKWREIAKLYDVRGVPHAIFVDRQGFIRHRIMGSFSTTEEIEAYIRELI